MEGNKSTVRVKKRCVKKTGKNCRYYIAGTRKSMNDWELQERFGDWGSQNAEALKYDEYFFFPSMPQNLEHLLPNVIGLFIFL